MADSSQTGRKDFDVRGADEDRLGIIKERKVERCTETKDESAKVTSLVIETHHRRRILQPGHLCRLQATNGVFLYASEGRNRLEWSHNWEGKNESGRE